MAVRKTHVKSDKRIKREKERKEAAASGAKRQHSKKHKLGSKKKTAVDTRFKFKSQAERYKDISVDLASLIEDAVERFGRWDALPTASPAKGDIEDGMDAESANEESEDEDEDMLTSPMSVALAELGLLNTSIPFQALHRAMYPITRSLPLILHHKQTIADLLVKALTNPDHVDLALSAPQTIDLIPSFIQCLTPDPAFEQLQLDTILTPLMQAIVGLAIDPPSLHLKTGGDRGNDPNSPVEISKRAFQVLAWTFRQIGSDLVNGSDYTKRHQAAWSWVVDGLSGQKPIVRLRTDSTTAEVLTQEALAEEEEDTLEEPDGGDQHNQDNNQSLADITEVDTLSDHAIPDEVVPVAEADPAEDELDNASDSGSDTESSAEGEDLQHGKTSRSSRRRPLSATKPHLRRLLATCFAFLLRRAKTGEALDSVVGTVLQSLHTNPVPELCESVAWLLLESVKSVETHIHSRGPAILRAFIRQASISQSNSVIEVLNAATTGILHHGRVETLSTISEVILSRFNKLSVTAVDFDVKLALNLVCVLSGTRRGNRLLETEKAAILPVLGRLLADMAQKPDLLPLTIETATLALLNAPNLQSMLESGRQLLESIWTLHAEMTPLAYAAFDTLSEQQWKYFGDFAVPLIQRSGKDRLGNSAYTSLLASISNRGQLPPLDTIVAEVGGRFAEQIRAWTISFKNGKVTERQSQDLMDSLAVCSTLSRHEELLEPVLEAIELLSRIHNSEVEAREDFQRTPVNSAAILSTFLHCLSSMSQATALPDNIVLDLLKVYYWHRAVLSALASLVSVRPSLPEASIAEVYKVCKHGLLSEDASIRMSTLIILEHRTKTSEIIRKALDVERIPLTPQDAREKTMHLRRLGICLKQAEEGSDDIEIGLLYSFGMLKVNFKPLWAEAIDVVSELCKARPSSQPLIWSILSKQLYNLAEVDMRDSEASGASPWLPENEHPPPHSALASWRSKDLICTAFLRLTSTFDEGTIRFSELVSSNNRKKSLADIENQLSDSRLSSFNFESQLLALAENMRALTEQHSRDFLELFFRQFGVDRLAPSDGMGGKIGRERLSNWLKVLSKFKNPKAVYRSDELYGRMLQLLSHGDAAIQGLALDGILTWKSPNLVPYEVNFRNMLQSSHLRDELLQFSLAEDTSDIMPERREQVVDLTIRVLYGLMSSRQGRASAINVQRSRKSAILNALKACQAKDLDVLVDLMTSSFQDQITRTGDSFVFAGKPEASASQQLGYLALLGDTMSHLAEKIRPHWDRLFQVTLNLAYHSRSSQSTSDRMRHIRQLAFRRMSDFFRLDPSFNAALYLTPLFTELISPRLPQFGAENAQGPSALLDLVATWASYEETAFNLARYDQGLLPALYSTLATPNVKDTVILRILEIVQKILVLSSDNETVRQELLESYVDPLLSSLSRLLTVRSSALSVRDLIGIRLISVLSSISPFIAGRQYAENLLPLLLPLLSKPNMLIPENIKTDLLKIMQTLLPDGSTATATYQAEVLERSYRTVCSLLGTMRTRNGRVQVLAVFRQLQIARKQQSEVSDILDELNAFSVRRMDVPDFDRRLAAFQALNEQKYKTLSATDWVPLLANMFFFIQDLEELSIRSNANATLRRFVQVAGPSLDPTYRLVFSKNFMPALRRALRSKVDVVRVESISVLHAAVQANTGFAELDEMKCLLAGDEEASFFNNIYHIQAHRRARALRRLAEEAEARSISSKTVNDIFLPLVAYNLAAAAESKAQEVVNETVTTIGRLASALHWGAYHRLLQQYFTSAAEKRDNQKVHVRVLVAILKGFKFDLKTMAVEEKHPILSTVETKVLPRLLQFLQSRNETDEALRIPVAEGIAVIVQQMPEDHRTGDVTSLITALAQILRSKSQEVRDMTRSTITNIAIYLGPEYFSIFVKELRASLAKGPHLHVLAFVLHALLERVLSAVPSANIDDCLGDAVPIVYDDLLGYPAKDRESTELRSKTKYREVRLCKSMDSIGLLAAHVSPSKINALLGPLRGILADSDSARVMQNLDDILRHIAAGLQRNKELDNSTLLTLSQALISQNTDFLKPRKPKGKKDSLASKEYRVQMKRTAHAGTDLYAQNAFKFVAFGLDLLNGAFKKNRFDLSDQETVSRLDPLITLVGDTLFAEEAHVLDRALRAVSALIKCPLASIEKAAPILVKQMISILENMGGTASDLSQTAIRSLATLIRDRKSLILTDEQLSTLVAIISPDLEEPEQQAALFSLLRAIVSRKFASAEVYDLMDRVAEILIASQSQSTREICRSIYLQFLLDYPQGKKRLATSLQFLAKNLGGYVHESGRISALELVNAILSKFGADLLDQYADLFHFALVMDLANDESAKCRSMAAENCKLLYGRVSAEVRARLLDAILAWGKQRDNDDLRKVAAQASGLVVEAFRGRAEAVNLSRQVLPQLQTMVKEAAVQLTDADEDSDELEEGPLQDGAWQPTYQALASLHKIISLSPEFIADLDHAFNRSLRTVLIYPHAWIRQASSRLLGLLYSKAPDAPALDELIDAASASTTQLKSKHLNDTLALQIVKNLFFIGRRFSQQTTSVDEPDELEEVLEGGHETRDELHNAESAGAPALTKRSPLSNPFHWLFVKLSHRARVAHQMKPSKYSSVDREWRWSLEPMSILRWFAAIISEESISNELLAKQTHQILLPVVRMIEDPNGAQDPQMDELQALAREVQELLSQRLGVSLVTEAYSKIQRNMAIKREGRKRTTALQAVTNPEIEAQRRAKKNDSTMKNRKRKNESFKETKLKYGVMSKGKRVRRD